LGGVEAVLGLYCGLGLLGLLGLLELCRGYAGLCNAVSAVQPWGALCDGGVLRVCCGCVGGVLGGC
jgi:hypothetical protein